MDEKTTQANRRKRKMGIFQANLILPRFQITFVSWTIFISFFVLTLQYFVDNYMLLLGILLVIDVVLGIILSHSIVGPIYRIQKGLKENIVENKYSLIFTREGDIFKELEKDVNDFIEFSKK